MSSRTGEEDAELSAALGWPGGISEPLLDRAALLRMVGGLRAELASMRRHHDLRGADLTVAGHIAHALIGKARAALTETQR